MGILDFMSGYAPSFSSDPAASNMPNPALWGALNQPSPIGPDAEEAKRRAAEAALLGTMGLDPSSVPQRSSFDVAQQPLPAAAPSPAASPSGFGAGATPFGFAGPGSMTGISPAMLAPPPQAAPAAPIVAPQVAAAAPPATDVSSVNRPPINRAPPPAADDGPDSMVPVGKYQMPMFGEPGDAPASPAAAPRVAPGAGGSAPFSLGGVGSSIGDRLTKATTGFLGNLDKGPLGAIAGGAGALITGRNTDPASILAEKSNATAQALVAKGASVADVRAATNNPALMTALVAQYYGKDKWNVVQVGEDGDGHKTYMQQNTVDGTLRPIAGGPAAASGGASDFVTGPDGSKIPIPPGVNRKEFIKRVTEASADGATGKATEAQAKASSFAARMTQAEGVLGGLQNQGLSLGNKVAGEVPIAGNYMQSTDYQRYKQASSAFITALLRQESGAAINKSEFDRYEKELFPQPGDDASVVQQKAAQRAAAIEQMSRAAGPGYHRPAAGGTVNVGGSAINWSVK